MAKLGGAFSDEQRRQHARRQLKPGAVIHLDVDFPEGRKPKFLVVAHVDKQTCTLIVNSEVNTLVAKRPSLAICQVSIDAARHRFLRYDSFVACHRVERFVTDDVIAKLVDDPGRLKGNLHPDVIVQVIAAIKRAPTLSTTEQTAIANALAVT